MPNLTELLYCMQLSSSLSAPETS